jgi:hypothetical protein
VSCRILSFSSFTPKGLNNESNGNISGDVIEKFVSVWLGRFSSLIEQSLFAFSGDHPSSQPTWVLDPTPRHELDPIVSESF